MFERAGSKERAAVGYYPANTEHYNWKAITTVEKWSAARHAAGLPPDEVVEHVGNIRLIGGASILWERLITKNPSTSTTGVALQAFSSVAVIGVGTSTVAASKTQTGLQSTSKAYATMSSGYPSHTDGSTSTAAQSCQFAASFGTTVANFAWREWGVGNSSGGRFLNRSVGNLGTKTTGTWTLTLTLTETT